MDKLLLAYAQALDEREPPKDLTKCCNCGSFDFVTVNYKRSCTVCWVIDPHYKPLRFEDYSNYTQRSTNSYTPLNNFLKCMQQYQGNQITIIPDQVYEALQDTEITRVSILECLKKLKLTKYYKDTHLIYFDLTGNKVDNIDYLEQALVLDCKKFIQCYNTLGIDRTSFLSVQYVLYQLLRRRGHPCTMENFNLPKTKRSKKFHDRVCQRVFDELGWEFNTT